MKTLYTPTQAKVLGAVILGRNAFAMCKNLLDFAGTIEHTKENAEPTVDTIEEAADAVSQHVNRLARECGWDTNGALSTTAAKHAFLVKVLERVLEAAKSVDPEQII